jgi:hypothetical protein
MNFEGFRLYTVNVPHFIFSIQMNQQQTSLEDKSKLNQQLCAGGFTKIPMPCC